jgi:hypothetical protein
MPKKFLKLAFAVNDIKLFLTRQNKLEALVPTKAQFAQPT